MKIRKIYPQQHLKLEVSLDSEEAKLILNDLLAIREKIRGISQTFTFDRFLERLQEALE